MGRSRRCFLVNFSCQLSRQEASRAATRREKTHGRTSLFRSICQRVIVGDLYCDIPLGLDVIRGENVVVIGELHLEQEELPPHMIRVSVEEIKRAQKAERDLMDLKGSIRERMEFLDTD